MLSESIISMFLIYLSIVLRSDDKVMLLVVTVSSQLST